MPLLALLLVLLFLILINRELCFTHPNVGEWLSEDDRLITFLFSLLADARTFDAAIGLLEEVLGAKEETFDLARVPGFNALVRGMSDSQLGIFCRVLAMVVFEPDDRGGDEIGMIFSLLLANVYLLITFSLSPFSLPPLPPKQFLHWNY